MNGNVERANVCVWALTERVPSNHRLRLEVNSWSILVDSPDSEKVLCVFEQSSDVAHQLRALRVHDDPVQPVSVAPLYDVMRNLIAAILNGRLPAQCARFFCDFAN